jgi:FlaA1/EpsC-like NDP-sugar epimerase
MKRLLLSVWNVPRFFVLLIDFGIIVLSFVLSYFIVKQFEFPMILRGHFFFYTAAYSASALTVFSLMRIYAGVIRYTTIPDMIRIFTAIILSSCLYVLVTKLIVNGIYGIHSLNSGRILLINFFVSSSALIMLRIGVRGMYYYLKKINRHTSEKVIIYGADAKAIVIKQALESDTEGKFNVVGFLGERANALGLSIQSKRVFSFKHLSLLKNKYKIKRLVLTNDELAGGHKQKVINKCIELGIKVLTVPPSEQWVYGKLKLKQMQDLKIEDLLQREPIQISDLHIFNELSGKRILITGAAGSIGSEIVRQVLKYKPAMVILCDQAESNLHEIQLESEERFPDISIKTFIANVRNHVRMRLPFRDFHPHIVFHAAAYKHVPMMESHPMEAVLTNVLGTKTVADLSILYNVERFVMISTDKAVNPTNVMGASKRIAEIYVQSLSESNASAHTKFITTRFGNVLDSNGSVIPRFRTQIQNGGPVTVTHPDVTRYFMTIPEAVQLVLEAGTMGNGSEIFIFDMGVPIKIIDLANNMIRLAGLIVDQDIRIVFTGLRPGEKLYEELLNKKESIISTHHEKIKVVKVISYPLEQVLTHVNSLIDLARKSENESLVMKMKELVPEYKSQNSIYEKLDDQINDKKEKGIITM